MICVHKMAGFTYLSPAHLQGFDRYKVCRGPVGARQALGRSEMPGSGHVC